MTVIEGQKSDNNGVFLVIEGTDGSGKGTQFKLIKERLEREGYDVATFDFPQYDNESSYFVREYLNGKFGTADQVGPYTASLFYALDRYQAAPYISEALQQGKVVLANRFTGSNMGHQGTKFDHPEERRGYYIWLDNLEFQMLGIPRPDRSIVLRVPAETAQQLVDQKEARSYTDKKRDIHEADLGHMQRAVAVYDELCQLFPRDFLRVDCVRGQELMSIETVNELLWNSIQPLLPPKPSKQVKETLQKLETAMGNSYVKKTTDGYVITPAGDKWLKDAVTSTESSVYAFTDKLSPLTIAAAMARLSRRGDDMRVTILDEFANNIGKDEQLLKRVITAYGDDSVQQLAGLHFVVEGASKLMTNILEWGRLGAYLEQSTRYIYFDQKNKEGKYRYYVPTTLKAADKKIYVQHMDKIFDLYSEMVHDLTEYVRAHSTVPEAERDAAFNGATRAQACDAARLVLPTSTSMTIGFYLSGQALESLIMHLLSNELPEAQTIGQDLLAQARKVMPVLLERADKPERGGATIAYRATTAKNVKKFAEDYLPNTHGNPVEPVQLVSYWPRNELDLVADMLYEHSDLPLTDIQKEVNHWPIDRKHTVFSAYVGERLNRRHRPGRALEKAHYSWDLVCDFGVFCDLMRHRMVDDLEWQQITPRYGYEMPKLIEDADLVEQYEKCFELSLALYSHMQEKGYGAEAQYATLLGHRMRWKVTYNAREAMHLHELRTSPQGHPGYRKLVLQMHEKLSEVHPLIGESMQFVNQGEDAELTRLAAERYTQFKLNNLR
jgi:thymidylate kinase/thymidylate synthase ThyX